MPTFFSLVRTVVIGACVFIVPLGEARAGSDAFETFGDVVSYGLPAAAAVWSGSKGDAEGVLQLGLTFGVSVAATALLKETVDATRPNGGSKSFPSGHTSRAFAGASYLHYRYGLEVGLPAYALAFAVGYSRVDSDHHHWRDVIGGAVLANLAAFLLTERYDTPLSLNAWIDSKEGSYGVSTSMRF